MTAELPDGFPDIFGCTKHRPRTVELRLWSDHLADDYWSRFTVASGLSWSLSFDRDENGSVVTIVDCSWASDGLQEIGVDLADTPLVAIQTWDLKSSLDALVDCDRCEERLGLLDQVLIDHWSNGDGLVGGAGLPRFPRLKWTDSPAVIADAVINDLRERSILGETMTVLEGVAGWDLVPKAPVYIQFRLGLEGELHLEARKDFAYWGVAVDEPRVTKFSAAGFSVDGPNQFEMLLGPDPHDLFHRDAIETAVRAAVEVFEPRRRRIRVERIEGVSHIEGKVSEAEYATGQRRIDRTGWADMFEVADRRLDPLGDGDRLFDVFEETDPTFARLVALAHLDEFFDRMDDLQVLIPADAGSYLEEVESDPFASPERISSFVLRHCFRWSEQRARSTGEGGDDRNPDVLSIETVAHERFVGRLRDGELIEIGGHRVESPWNDTCVNGSFTVLKGRLLPPEPPPLIAPVFD